MTETASEGCGALVYAKQTNRYLFLLRNKSKHAGSWGIVGGKIDADETVIQGLVREIQEEIGADFATKKFIPLETFTADNHKFIYYTFVVNVDNEFVPELNDEHRGYCWVELDDYPKPLHPDFGAVSTLILCAKKFERLNLYYAEIKPMSASSTKSL